MCALRCCCSGCSHCAAAAQAEDFIQCRTQAEQLQLLNAVINSKDTLEALERECGKDKEEAGELCSGRLSCATRGHYVSAPHSSRSEHGRTPPKGGQCMHKWFRICTQARMSLVQGAVKPSTLYSRRRS